MNSIPPQGIPFEYDYWDYIIAKSKAFLYQNNSNKHSWFMHLDLHKLIKLPSWFIQWLQDFGPEINFFPHFINKKYEIFNKNLLDSKCIKISFSFPRVLSNPMILSLQYTIGAQDGFLILAPQIYIIWWDQFNSQINISLLPIELHTHIPSKSYESVSLTTQKVPASKSQSLCQHHPHQ